MRTDWASFSSRGRVTFDEGLLDLERDFGEHIIVHALLHLRLANHGPAFSALPTTNLPDCRRRAALGQRRVAV